MTVAAFREDERGDPFDPNDVRIIRTKDSGKGGQNRNKTESTIVAIHEPTGISAKAADRHQGRNLQTAMHLLRERVEAEAGRMSAADRNDRRRKLIGSGERGDKIRTYREQDDVVIDHRTGRKLRLRDVMNGRLD